MQHPQGRDDVGHLRDGEQPAQADHLDRDAAGLERGPQRGELGALAAQDRDVAWVHAVLTAVRPRLAVRGYPGRER